MVMVSHCRVDEPESGLSKSYLFDDGFAQLSASPYGYDSKTSIIQIVFATYSENGLIYFRGNPVRISPVLRVYHFEYPSFFSRMTKTSCPSNSPMVKSSSNSTLAETRGFV